MDEELTVVLADRRPLMREAFRVHFGREPWLRLVAEVSSAEEAEAALLRLRPRLLILQSDLLGGGQMDVLYRLRSWCPDTAVVVMGVSGLTTGELTEIAHLPYRWLPDNATADDLLAVAIDAARNGHNGSDSEPAGPAEGASAAAGEQPLTSRETEVLRLAAAGLSNRQIADQLVISRYTVRNHLRNILAKLKVKNRTAASAFIYASMFQRALTPVPPQEPPRPAETPRRSRALRQLHRLVERRAG